MDVIDLPPAPLVLGYQESALAGAPVRVVMMSGENVAGRLLKLDAPQHRVSVRRPQDEAVLSFNFAQVRLIAFSEPLSRSKNAGSLQRELGGVLLNPTPGLYRVTFTDDHTISGKLQAQVVDSTGLHFFAVSTGQRLRRTFIPHDVVKHYQIGRKLGEILAENTSVTEKNIDEALNIQRQVARTRRSEVREAAHMPRRVANQTASTTARSVIVPMRKVSDSTPSSEPAPTSGGPRLGEILVAQGMVTDRDVALALSRKFGLAFVDLRHAEIAEEAVTRVPADVARTHRIIPLRIVEQRIVAATDDPARNDGAEMIGFLTGLPVDLVVVSSSDLDWALEYFYGLSSAIEKFLSEENTNIQDPEEEARRLATNKPIVKLVEEIIAQAIHRRASDIHIRPGEANVELLLRIDGVMVPIRSFKKPMLLALVIRIKVMSGMNMAQHNVPQDGQIRVAMDGGTFDLRVSVIPTVNGESIVMRILNSKFGPKTLDELGMEPDVLLSFRGLLRKMHGMILVTGPTGSGKSTTLYGALNEIRGTSVNIITVEEPVEFHIAGIEQVQVDNATGLTFSRVLRNILRHDPDVIMIGEIRDEETARIATQSSLTGHLVLSTLHTNSAAGAITRLMDMGVESYLLAPTLLCIVAQRLIRRNCPECRIEEHVDESMMRHLGVTSAEQIFVGAGCDRCNGTGVQGRAAVYEVLIVTKEVEDAIRKELGEKAVFDAAVATGMTTLVQSGLLLARRGIVSLAEVYRLTDGAQ